MSLSINPDLGDSIAIQDSGNRWTVSYWFVEDGGPKTFFTAEFPRDVGEINPDQVEQAMMELAFAVARGKNVHS
jgi:hypothetical protein